MSEIINQSINESTAIRPAKRVSALLLVLALGMFGVMGITSSPASADADGCTLAPGPAGAYNCVNVEGSSTTVNKAHSIYGALSVNICNPTSTFKYNKTGSYAYKTMSATTCAIGRAWTTWNSPGVMKDQSQFCAKQKNTASGGVYSNYACITIKK